MQANYEFSIRIKGSSDDLTKSLDLMRSYEARTGEVYLTDIKIQNGSVSHELKTLDSETLVRLTSTNDSILLTALGPYGKYHAVSETKIYERIADEIPNAEFYGEIDGGSSYTTEKIEAELKEGILHLKSCYECVDDTDMAYYNYITEKMPYQRFLEVFMVNEDEFEEDDYEEFMSESDCYESFMREDYDEFQECCPGSEISKKDYSSLKKQLAQENLDHEAFLDGFEEGSIEEYDYDPAKREYLDEARNSELSGCGIIEISAESLDVDEGDFENMSMDEVYEAIEKKLGLKRTK